MSDIVIRRYKEGDEAGIVSLLDTVFHGWPRRNIPCDPVDFWRWKFTNNPNPSFVTVAENDGEIIGCHHVYQIGFWVKGKELSGTYSCDFAVHPEYRRRGVSNRMRYEFSRPWRTEEGMMLDFSVVGNPIVVKSSLKTNYLFPEKIVNLVLVSGVNGFSSFRFGWFIGKGFAVLSGLNRLLYRSKSNSDVFVEEVSFFPDIDELWSLQREYYEFISDHSTSELNRKYCDSRNPAFKIFLAYEEEKVVGYCVLRVNSFGEQTVGYFVELVAQPGREEVVSILIEAGINCFKRHKVGIMNFLASSKHTYVNYFKAHGFVDSRISLTIVYLPEKDEFMLHDLLTDHSKIMVSWGDLDILPTGLPNYGAR